MYPKAKPLSMNGLSLLAKGNGLLDGGVEVECHSQAGYSLSGQSFTKPSHSRKGQYATAVKPYILNLPKTFVTRRGALVLFTSPEDMIIGQSCHVYEQTRVQNFNTLSRKAAQDLKTTSNLAISALSYDNEKDSGISEGEGDNVSPLKPGNFTNVYIKSLDKLKDDKQLVSSSQQQYEKTDDAGITEILIPVDSDSGFDSCSHPTTSGRLSSALSYHSDIPPTTIVSTASNLHQSVEYTDERETQVHFDDNVDILNNNASTVVAPTKNEDESKELFASLLSSNQTLTVKPTVKHTKKKGPANKKKLTPSDQRITKTTTCRSPPASDNNSTGITAKKSSRKRTKKLRKIKDVPDLASNSSNDSQVLVVTKLELTEEEETILSSNIHIDDISDLSPTNELKQSLGANRLGLQSARAEQRRLEIERKRQEKRELELQRKEELARQAELMQQLSSYQGELDDKENVEEQSILSLADDIIQDLPTIQENVVEDLEIPKEETHVHQPIVTKKDPSTESALLKRAREMREKAQKEEQRKREAEQEQLRLKQVEEEQLKKARKGLERIEQTIREQNKAEAQKRMSEKDELTYQKRLELETHKYQQRKTTVNYFSYFNYLPTKQSKDKRKKQRTAMPKRNTS